MSKQNEMGGFMTQFPVKKDVATWRQEEITVPALGLKTVMFSDTRPNMFYIQNTNDIHLFLGITKIPNENSYEWRVEKNNSRTFGRPVPTNTLHILNPANKDITVTLFSVNAAFDISVLQNFFFDADVISGIAFDGIIKGFGANVPLPSGTNHLGSVDINELPESNNHIGVVSLPEETTKTFTDILSVMDEVKAGLEESNKKIVDFLYYERQNINVPVEVDFSSETFIPDYISFIANDGEDYNIIVTLTLANGNSKTFTLAKGDIFGDLKMEVKSFKIAPESSNVNITWRCMFGKRG